MTTRNLIPNSRIAHASFPIKEISLVLAKNKNIMYFTNQQHPGMTTTIHDNNFKCLATTLNRTKKTKRIIHHYHIMTHLDFVYYVSTNRITPTNL